MSAQLIDTEAMEKQEEVDPLVLKNGLHCIGKTFNNSRHAFLSLSIPDQNLAILNGVQKYKYLQNIDVSGNQL